VISLICRLENLVAPFFGRKVGHNVEHNVGQPLERMVNRSLSDGLFHRVVQHAVRRVVRNVGRIVEQTLGRSFGRSFERSLARNFGQTLVRIVIDRRCEWEVGCSISGWRPCRLCLQRNRAAAVDGTDGSAAYAPDTHWGPSRSFVRPVGVGCYLGGAKHVVEGEKCSRLCGTIHSCVD
jgi:hypothetical protein